MNNKMSVKLVLIFFVLIQLILVSNNPAIADPLDSILTAVECEVTITPNSPTMLLGQTQQLCASTTCNGDTVSGTYFWSFENGTANTTTGDCIIYTPESYDDIYIVVTDVANGNIQDTAQVEVVVADRFFITVQPEIISRSMWIMLPAIIDITCNFEPCDLSSKVSYKPVMSVLPMPPLIIHYNIRQLIFVIPVWLTWKWDETITVTVTTKWSTASDTIEIKILPFPLDEQKELK